MPLPPQPTTAATMDRARSLCRARLGSAFRTALACAIVCWATLYGPSHLRHQLPYPAFSYMVVILIVPDAALGDAFRGCWHALYATVQVAVLAVLGLWLMGTAQFNAAMAALMVAVSVFVVALPESTQLMAKRLAFGQIVIVYVGAVVLVERTGVLMHPMHVAASTTLGALASVLALVLPFPRFASREIRKILRSYAENASERLNLFVKAFSANDNPTAVETISQAKSFTEAGAKLFRSIELMQEGVLWERPRIRFLKCNCRDRLQETVLPMRGMEIALTSCPSFPISISDQELRDVFLKVKVQIGLKPEQANCFLPLEAATAPQTMGEPINVSLQTPKTVFPTQQDLRAFFFLYCMKLLEDNSNPKSILENGQKLYCGDPRHSQSDATACFKRIQSIWKVKPSGEQLVFAFKCSASLGLAVLLGLIFNKENAYWSGLTIAISFVTGRQATFTVANARAQGIVMGSVYGILGCFVFRRFMFERLLLLLPWIIFTSFLMHSRMYGQEGGTSAVIGALLILGRKNYGPPREFAIARITEAFIGLSCFIFVEILLRPTRAATLAKIQLSGSLMTLQECIKEIVICAGQRDKPGVMFPALREKHKKLKTQVDKLEKFIGEAELEPSFWYLPFPAACYRKLLGSLSKMRDLLLFVACKIEFPEYGIARNELQEHIHGNIEHFKEMIGSSLKYLAEVTSITSFAVFEKEMQKKIISHDLDSEKSQNERRFRVPDEEEVEKITLPFLQHLKEIVGRIHAAEGEEELKSQMVLHLTALGFCLSTLMEETKEIEKEVEELVQKECPLSHTNLLEICHKIKALYTR